MNDKMTIEHLEHWFDANAGNRRSYAQKQALRFCGLLINAMKEIEYLKRSNDEANNGQ